MVLYGSKRHQRLHSQDPATHSGVCRPHQTEAPWIPWLVTETVMFCDFYVNKFKWLRNGEQKQQVTRHQKSCLSLRNGLVDVIRCAISRWHGRVWMASWTWTNRTGVPGVPHVFPNTLSLWKLIEIRELTKPRCNTVTPLVVTLWQVQFNNQPSLKPSPNLPEMDCISTIANQRCQSHAEAMCPWSTADLPT